MKIQYKLLCLFSFSLVCLVNIFTNNHSVLAQFRGQDSQQFFEQGNQQIEQQIQEIQRDNIQTERENQERQLEQQLEINNSNDSEVKEVPTSPPSIDENVEESPDEEIKF